MIEKKQQRSFRTLGSCQMVSDRTCIATVTAIPCSSWEAQWQFTQGLWHQRWVVPACVSIAVPVERSNCVSHLALILTGGEAESRSVAGTGFQPFVRLLASWPTFDTEGYTRLPEVAMERHPLEPTVRLRSSPTPLRCCVRAVRVASWKQKRQHSRSNAVAQN